MSPARRLSYSLITGIKEDTTHHRPATSATGPPTGWPAGLLGRRTARPPAEPLTPARRTAGPPARLGPQERSSPAATGPAGPRQHLGARTPRQLSLP
ncbi:hypothetical protein AB0M79_05890 [Polymorphospora sp. NPDC051019]|uniref:hypothetical protein n=1 Tax=Polymorphospora sp. NPDC051019 TaxID=3155725 RepID=UPI0034491326